MLRMSGACDFLDQGAVPDPPLACYVGSNFALVDFEDVNVRKCAVAVERKAALLGRSIVFFDWYDPGPDQHLSDLVVRRQRTEHLRYNNHKDGYKETTAHEI